MQFIQNALVIVFLGINSFINSVFPVPLLGIAKTPANSEVTVVQTRINNQASTSPSPKTTGVSNSIYPSQTQPLPKTPLSPPVENPVQPVIPTVPSTKTEAVSTKEINPCITSLKIPVSRSAIDQTDDQSGYQVHIVYVLPSDGTDHAYDTNGAIATSVSSWEDWLCTQTGGQGMKVDTHNGALDVTFVRLNQTDKTVKEGSDLPWSTSASSNPYVRDDLEKHLRELGFIDPHKLYAVYYDGHSNTSCGGGAWPPNLKGHVAAEYMQGGNPVAAPCESNFLASSATNPGYLDFDMLHETMHTLGFVPTCSPHQTLRGHVSDSPSDLMYAGAESWKYPGLVLDVGHDDYFKASIPNCLDLSKSIFMTGGGTELPPGW